MPSGDIRCKDLRFAYTPDREVLRGVDITMPRGSFVALANLGSTLQNTFAAGNRVLDLLEEPPAVQDVTGREEVPFTGAQVSHVTFSYGEETALFHDSIRSNLRIAKRDATDAEIEQACRKASVHDFIMSLPQGYDTPVGELGDTLSGGERQRLGLARAFLHDAPLMLLDEPTSNLDSLNEAVILRSLREERQGKTVVLVSHRASTMWVTDTVWSVENGRMS